MSYSQLALSDRPLGYWDGVSLSRKNLLTSNQYSLETSTTGWSALPNSSISRVTTGAWVGSASLKITANSIYESGAVISSGSRIQVYPGRFYTMIARVKNISGSRNASIKIKYYTTQSGSTESESPRNSESFVISNSEWTTIYHTEIVPASTSVNYFAAWGVETSSGSSNDEILIDGIQFFEGTLYQSYDNQYDNDAVIRYYNYENTKPIIFGAENSIKIDDQSFIEITNNYKLFIKGSEDKNAALEFWFALERPPSYRHQLVSLGSGISCYIEDDRVYIDYLGERQFVRISDWNRQHHIYLVYANRQISMYLNNSLSASIALGSDFYFNPATEFIVPTIVIGPSSPSYNIAPNPSFEGNNLIWEAENSSISAISSDFYSGSKCLEVTKQAVANSGCSVEALQMLEEFKQYTLSAFVKIPSGQQSATLRLKCNTYSSFDKSELVSSYTQTLLVNNNNWNRISLSFTTDLRDRVAEIIIDQPTSGTAGQKFLVDSVLLEKLSYARQWSETSYRSDPIFINGIALYSEDIGSVARQKRIEYATVDSDNQLAIQKDADVFDLRYQSFNEIQRVNLLASVDDSQIENLSFNQVSIFNNPLSPESVSLGFTGGTANISEYGLVLTGDAYLTISQSLPFFNVNASTIRLQTQFSTITGNGYLLFFDNVIGYYGLALRKYNNKIQGVLLEDIDSEPEVLFETLSLTTSQINIALNFSGLNLSCKIGSQEFSNISIPAISEDCGITIGNIPQTSNAYPDPIRNFAIDKLTEFSNIDFIQSAKYMLRMTEDLNVSQKSSFTFSVIPSQATNNNIFTLNTAGKNKVIVNNQEISENINVPSFNYGTAEEIEVEVILESDNSTTGYNSFNSGHIALFNSDTLNSNLGNFTLSHNMLYEDIYQDTYVDEYGGYIPGAFAIQTIPSNVLSHDDNLGVRFIKNISTGCKIVPNQSTYRCIEFVFKINAPAINGETYNIFDISGGSDIYLKLDDSGLIKSGTYDLYIDGQEITNLSSASITPGEFYHLFVVFPSALNSNIHLGKDKNLSNCIDGSIGKLNIYTSVPSSEPTFILEKYQDLVGRITKVVDGGSATLRDSELTQQYIRSEDESYYEMVKLPRIKIFNA